jgi:hypothetical protein
MNMRSAKRWFLIAATVAVPFAASSCSIALPNGCTYDINEAHFKLVQDPEEPFGAPKEVVWYSSGMVCP